MHSFISECNMNSSNCGVSDIFRVFIRVSGGKSSTPWKLAFSRKESKCFFTQVTSSPEIVQLSAQSSRLLPKKSSLGKWREQREEGTAFACWCSKRASLASRDSSSYLPSLIWLLKSYAVWILICQMYHHCYTFQRQTFLDTFEERDTREIFLTDYLKLHMYYKTLTCICSKYIKAR